MSVYNEVSGEKRAALSLSYHCLRADAVCAVDPDVFGHNFAMLGEIEVFLQLEARDKVSGHSRSKDRLEWGLGKAYVCSIRDCCGSCGHFRGLLIRDLGGGY
jgi:hypothetical protein